MAKNKYRLNLDLPAPAEDMLKQLIKDTGAGSRNEVIRQALNFYSFLVEKKGERVTLTFKNGILLVQENKPQ